MSHLRLPSARSSMNSRVQRWKFTKKAGSIPGQARIQQHTSIINLSCSPSLFSSVINTLLVFSLEDFYFKTFTVIKVLKQPLNLPIFFPPGSIGLSCPCWPVKHLDWEQRRGTSPSSPLWTQQEALSVCFYRLPANLLQPETPPSPVNGTEVPPRVVLSF